LGLAGQLASKVLNFKVMIDASRLAGGTATYRESLPTSCHPLGM
jgi:hypothetical protein